MAQVQFRPLVASTGTSYNWSEENWDPAPPGSGDTITFSSTEDTNPSAYTSVIDAGFAANLDFAGITLEPGVTLDVQQSETFDFITGDSSTDTSTTGLILVGNGATLTGAINDEQNLYIGSDSIGTTGTFSLSNEVGGVAALTIDGLRLDMTLGQSGGTVILSNATFDTTDAASMNAVWSGGTLSLAGNTVVNIASANYIEGTNDSSPGPIVMSGTNNELILPSDQSFIAADALTISNFSVSDKIELSGVTPGSAAYFTDATGAQGQPDELDIYSGPNGSGTLITSLFGVTIDPASGLTGNIPASDFTVGRDASGTFIQLACFAAGTRIATSRGQVPVERLREGDAVVTCRGSHPERGTAPVVWVGRRRVDLARHPAASLVQPVRIKAGAIAPGIPARALRVSPEHALFFHGVLIPARLLVNGSTVVQERVAEVTYYHIELPAHDILLAEGVPAESWLDTGNRSMFENAGPAVPLIADFRNVSQDAWAERACAPLHEDGPVLQAVRKALASRAAELGFDDGTVQTVPLAEHSAIAVTVAPGARIARLVSGVTQAPGDLRRLGAVILGLSIGGKAIPLDGPRVRSGFHATERHGDMCWRWTDGEGVLVLHPKWTGKTLTVTVAACAAPDGRASAQESRAAA